MIVWQDVVDIAPELSTVVAGTQNAILAAVNGRLIRDDSVGPLANDLRKYLAAHLASIRGNEGLVTSETLGAMSRTYALPPGIKGSLALSTYGAEYERLLFMTPCALGFVP